MIRLRTLGVSTQCARTRAASKGQRTDQPTSLDGSVDPLLVDDVGHVSEAGEELLGARHALDDEMGHLTRLLGPAGAERLEGLRSG